MLPPQLEQDDAALAESRTITRKPPLFRVLLHNDDFTTMEFVVKVLETIFGHSTAKAVQIMLMVHTRGTGIAGVYPYEVAEMKIGETTSLARANEFPLLCTMEEE